MISTLFKQKKPKQFLYTPRYYDEVKEDIEFRKRVIKQKLKECDEPNLDVTSITKGFLRNSATSKPRFSLSIEWMVSVLLSLAIFMFYDKIYAIIPICFPIVVSKLRKLK